MESYRVGLISLGCPKNQVDAEMMLSNLRENGFTITNDAAEADAVIVNTCGFIEDAKKEAIENILEAAALKQTGRLKVLAVTGCLAQRYGTEIGIELPEADVVVPLARNADIAVILRDALSKTNAAEIPAIPLAPPCLTLSGSRILTTPFYSAYLRIADGCDNRCAYCAIPMIRGGFVSRRVEDVTAEAETLTAGGVREINLIAQDTTNYGMDLYGRRALPELLTRLAALPVDWIRILYAYPDGVTDELLDVMAREPKIVPYLDLPLQHASGKILRAMNREGDSASLLALIRHIRERIPNIALRTTVMVGFPGETAEDFTELVSFIQEARFDRLGCFRYSKEEGTPAASFPHQVEEETAARREEILMTEQMRIADETARRRVGTTVSVLAEGRDANGQFYGRAPFDAPEIDGTVFFASPKPFAPGDMAPVTITEARGYSLFGEVKA